MVDLEKAKKDFNSIADFIIEIDEDGKIVLLPQIDFCKGIIELTDENFISIYFEFKDLLTSKLLSARYIAEQWQNIETFKLFINDRMESINNEIDREWQRDIIKYVRSDKPTHKKVDYLVELIADIELTELKLKDTGELKPTKKFLKILLQELKDKQKFERSKQSQIPNETGTLKFRNNENLEIITKNIYSRIFNNSDAFLIFTEFKKNIRERYKLADYSFIYRQMWNDKLIYIGVKEKEFRDWLLETFQIELTEPLKTIDECKTENKFNLYSMIKNSK